MIATLKKHGNSQALVVNRSMMETMGIEQDTPLQVSVSQGTMTVQPTNVGVGEQEIRKSIKKLRKRYTPMLQRLAKK